MLHIILELPSRTPDHMLQVVEVSCDTAIVRLNSMHSNLKLTDYTLADQDYITYVVHYYRTSAMYSTSHEINVYLKVDDVMHFIYSHKYNTNSTEDSSDIN